MNKILDKPSLACALFDPQNYQHQFINNISEGLKKVDYSVSKISTMDNKARMKVSINYFQLDTIITNGQAKLREQFEKQPFTSAQENIDETYKAIEEAFNEGPSDKTTDIEVTLEKKNDMWVIDESFIKTICEGILK